tara:strand:+ start:91 stop:300 length:210 start_codon:yes stop_codon:yes gene_type:complete
MPHFGYTSLGFGSGTTAAAEAVFSVEIQDTQANILARTSDDTGTIAYGTDTKNFYVFDGDVWFNYPEQQ